MKNLITVSLETKQALRGAIFEAFFVVLGVGLAYIANEWRQTRKDRLQEEQALSAIQAEMETNLETLKESLTYHKALLQMLFSKHDEGWTPKPQDFSRGFVSPAQLSRTSWESASLTGVLAKTSFAQVSQLSNIYAHQERYEIQAQSVGTLIYEALFYQGTASVVENHRNLAAIISTFVYRETDLLNLYEKTLDSM